MTINFSALRDGFGVLGADSLSNTTNHAGRDIRWFHRKLYVHPTLPVAVTSSGLALLGGRYSIDRVADSLTETTAHDLTVESVRGRLRDHLHPLVVAEIAAMPTQPAHAEPCLHLDVAVYGANGAEFGRLYLAEQAIDEAGPGVRVPDPLHGFFEAYPETDWGGWQLVNRDDIVARARQTITAAIQADAELHGGTGLTVGGTIDIAVVDVDGAALLPAEPADWPCSVIELPLLQQVADMYASMGWALEQMPAAQAPFTPIERQDGPRRVLLNTLVEDRLIAKYSIHELAAVALNNAWAEGRLPAAATNDPDRWQETLCRQVCTSLDVTEYPFDSHLDPVPTVLEVLAQELVAHAGEHHHEP